MYDIFCDVAVIGAGPAGLSAAVAAKKEGAERVLLIERDESIGGILQQCIHPGFGLTYFKEELTGPEYAGRFEDEAKELGAEVLLNSMVLEVDPREPAVYCVNAQYGMTRVKAGSIVLAMGCREKTRAGIQIPGTRPAGIYTAGAAQRLLNRQNTMVGKEIVILGSGDIGMIMARRMTLEGAHVQAVFELQPYASGLPRNIEQCLRDYDIPLYLSHTVTDILGKDRLEGVVVAQVDEKLQPVPGTEKTYHCDTLILSVGLIPENELSLEAGVTLDDRSKGAVVDENYQTDVEGIFAAGNVLHVHDLVDFVSMEAEKLADAMARYIREGGLPPCELDIKTDGNVTHTIPQKVSGKKSFRLAMRVRRPMKDGAIEITQDGKTVKRYKFKKALPAEMIQIPVEAEKLNGEAPLEVNVIC